MKYMTIERVDRLFSRLGICTRKEVQNLICKHQIMLGDTPVSSVNTKVHPLEIIFHGQPLDHPGGIAVLFYKPHNVICTRLGDNTIFQFFPESFNIRRPLVNSAGRLDKDTTGALIVTDDGELTHKIISPKYRVPKIYEIELEEPLTGKEPDIFKRGTLKLPDEDKPCKPADFEIISENTGRLTLFEGRFHQVKKMFDLMNNNVLYLHRSMIGSLELGNLEPGQWRDLNDEDYRLLGI